MLSGQVVPRPLQAAAVLAAAAALLTAGCSADSSPDAQSSAVPSAGPSGGTVTLRPTGSTPTRTPTPAATLPALDIVEQVREAVRQSRSVAVRGSVTTDGGRSAIDLRLHEDGATGTVESAGTTVEVRRLRDAVYVRSEQEAAYESLAAGRSAQLRGRWIRLDSEDPRIAGLRELTSFGRVRSWALGANLSVRDPDVVREGRRVVTVRNPDTGARLVVPADGPPHPLALRRDDAEVRGELSFSAWNEPVEVLVPPAAEVTTLS